MRHQAPTKEEALQEVAEHFARDMKVLFGNFHARRKNLKRARDQVRYLFALAERKTRGTA